MTRMGWHYTPCDRGGGGGGAAAVILVTVVIIAAIARPAAQAAAAVGRVVVEALEIAGIVLASAAGLAVLAGMAWGASRVYRWHARNRQAIFRHAPVILKASEGRSAARKRRSVSGTRPAIAPRHVIDGTGLVADDESSERRRARWDG